MKARRKMPVSALIFLLICITILCSLGTWQIQRLHWKNALIQAIDLQYMISSLPRYLGADAFLKLPLQTPPMIYGTVQGRFRHDLEMRVGPRTHDGQPGYHLITPLSLEDKSGMILVNRGWVPLDKAEPSTRPEDVNMKDIVTLVGLARLPDKPNFFTPDNDPEHHVWYSINPKQMSEAASLQNIPDAVFYVEVQNNPDLKGPYPVTTATRMTLHNNHLQYAIFWFTMAFLFAALPLAYNLWPLPKE